MTTKGPPPPKLSMKDDNLSLLGSTNISQPLPLLRFNRAEEWREPLVQLRQALVDKMEGQSHFNSVLLEMRTAFRNELSQCDYQLKTNKVEYTALFGKLKETETGKDELESVLNKVKEEKSNLAGEKEGLEKSNDALAIEIAQLKKDYHEQELLHFQERYRLVSDAQIELVLDRIKDDRQWKEDEAKLKEEYKGRDRTIAAMKELVHQAETGKYPSSWSRTRYGDESISITSYSSTD